LFIYTPQTNTLIQNTQHSSFIKSITSSGSGDMYIGTRQEGIICFAPNGIYKRSFSPDLQTTEQNNETNALYYYNDTLWFSLGTNSLNMLDLKSNRIHTFPTQFGTTNVTNIQVGGNPDTAFPVFEDIENRLITQTFRIRRIVHS
jgi:two-component system sensor histidine kinase/response regulator hybrid